MINKIFKRIHNKYSSLFKFLFYLRYLFAIFFVAVVLFLLIPHFFDLKKKDKIIKSYLLKGYDLTLKDYDDIKYNFFPIPNLEIQNAKLSIESNLIIMNVENLNIYPKLLSIYNYKNFEASKIVLNNNKILLSDSNFKIFIYYIYNIKKKLSFKNSNLKINRKKILLLNLEKIYFSNYGYNKNIVTGEIFEKKFKILTSDNYNKINFRLLKTGITADINFTEIKKDSMISGVLKSKLLNSKLRFNFDHDNNKINIYNSYFRNKNLSFNNQSTITYHPFFSINSILSVEDINTDWLKEINLNEILIAKKIIKKLNIKNEIKYKSSGFRRNQIDNLNLKINLAYGRLVYSKTISVLGVFSKCNGDLNLLEEYPILYFDCSITSKDKQKFLKKLSIKYKNKNELLKLNVKGNVNILNNKVNFENITMNQNYKATKEDLDYFKQSFETTLFDQSFKNIFNLEKIRKFILEIS